MYLWTSNIRSHKLDVQEANVSVSQFYRIGNYFFGFCIEIGRNPYPRFMGVVIEVLHLLLNKKSSIQEVSGNRNGFKEAAGNCLRMSSAKLKTGNQNV